jgi:cyclophilin family peptidyl-prolyl cis-trans isomerase
MTMKRLFAVIAVVACVAATPFLLAALLKEDDKPSGKNPVVVMNTSMGKIKIELYPDKSPATVKNFLSYVDDKFYDGTIFHRVISNFMIQGGGFEAGLKEKKTKAAVKNESDNGLSNTRGTIAMARTDDPDSATAQWFINVKDNKRLDGSAEQPGYTVFGKVIEGMDVVDKIKAVEKHTATAHTRGGDAPFDDVPVDDVVIKSVRRVDK